ncbi:MAG: phosphoenolpyruvate carboxylase [Deltaproteobacteria bacterium]|nr:phosphoenolpyruvate carboxylase [Deltaproteobacteria bacterium]
MESELLRADLARLTRALWSAVATLGGGRIEAMCRRVGDMAHALRAGKLARRDFAAEIETLSEDELEAAARAHALECHLMNTAEERERLRALHARGDDPADGAAAAIDHLIEAGFRDRDFRALFDRALVMPVITAHPTESRRRSSLDHLTRIAQRLDESGDAMEAEVLALHATEDARVRRPTPLDEVETALEVFRRSLLEVTPRLYRTLEDRLELRLGGTWRLPTFLRWGTWVGGDRDGNPNVTAAVTRAALQRQRQTVLTRYLHDVEELGRGLSISALRARGGSLDELVASVEHDRERLPEVAAHARPRTVHEPWREKLWYVQARLRATLDHGEHGYVDAARYRADLAVLDRTLRAAGFEKIANQELRDALRRVDVFGFHLASLDLRQHSGVHDRVVGELLARGGRPGYLELDEARRRAVLGEVLAQPIAPVRDREALTADARELLWTLDVVGRARRELGPRACERYITSFTRDVSDLLEVVFLARAAGLAPGELRPVPLLEQLEDLDRAEEIARGMLGNPVLRTELGGELEVMVGYSDSGKQVGYVASSMALRHAQQALARVATERDVLLTIFHGRGGALGRGGGPASDAIRAQPAQAIRGRMRVTEQGETVTARYARPAIAERDLELTLAAILGAAAEERLPDGDPAIEQHLATAADAARGAYLTLTRDEDLLARYTVAATPIEDVAHLPIGSRPTWRAKKMSLETLRAIPWVFSWTQSRHGIPGWFGVGTAVESLVAQIGAEQTRHLCEQSRFFRALVRNCEVSLVRSDIDVAREYARLADPDAAQLFTLIEAEHARTVHALRDTLGMTPPLASRAYLVASVERRNPHLDVLSHIQIEALRRRRGGHGDAERLTRIVFTTIGGIAAGLQTAG